MKNRLKGFYIDLIELLKRSLGFADYDLYLFNRGEYFSRKFKSNRKIQNLKMTSLESSRQGSNSNRLIDDHIDFVIGELKANELDQIYVDKNDEIEDKLDEKVKKQKFKNSKHQPYIQLQPIFSMPISALFIESSLCSSLKFTNQNKLNSIDYLLCSNHQIALNRNVSFFKVFDSRLWTSLVGCYLSISLLMYFLVNFGSSFTYTLMYSNCSRLNDIKENRKMNINDEKNDKSIKLYQINSNNDLEIIKSTLKEHDHLDENLDENRFGIENKKEENRLSTAATLIELPDTNHLSSSTTNTNTTQLANANTANVNDHLVIYEQTGGLGLVELDMNLYGTLNTRQISNLSNSNSTNLITQPFVNENQLITIGNSALSLQQQNQLDAYQLEQQLNAKQQSTFLHTATIDNSENLILHSNLANINSLDASRVAVDHQFNNLNSLNGTLGENIELINNSISQSVYNMNVNDSRQLSPYLDDLSNLSSLKDNQKKQDFLINTLFTEKYPLSNSLLIHDQLKNQLNNQLNQLDKYPPSEFVQFQLLNNQLNTDHQSIIIGSIPNSNATKARTLTSNSQQQLSNNNQQCSNEQSNYLTDYHLSKSINHKNQLKNMEKSMLVRLVKTIKRDHYRSNLIELSTCFWYTMAIVCHQKVPFKRRFVN